MDRIRLADYVKTQQHYLLNPRTGLAEELGLEASAGQRPAGYARRVRLGLLGRQHLLGAIYAAEARLWLQLGSKRFDLTAPGVRVQRSIVAPFVRRFAATLAGKELFSALYWMPLQDSMAAPDYDDFFRYVEEIARDRTSIGRAVDCWTGGTPGCGISSEASPKQPKQR
jgi:hypothetical protein